MRGYPKRVSSFISISLTPLCTSCRLVSILRVILMNPNKKWSLTTMSETTLYSIFGALYSVTSLSRRQVPAFIDIAASIDAIVARLNISLAGASTEIKWTGLLRPIWIGPIDSP